MACYTVPVERDRQPFPLFKNLIIVVFDEQFAQLRKDREDPDASPRPFVLFILPTEIREHLYAVRLEVVRPCSFDGVRYVRGQNLEKHFKKCTFLLTESSTVFKEISRKQLPNKNLLSFVF